MWTRAELKARAKAGLHHYYGPALLVSFIANLFKSGSGGGSNVGSAAGGINAGVEVSSEMDIPMENMEGLGDMIADVPGTFDSFMEQLDPVFLSVIASVFVVALVIGLAISIFVAPIFTVGKNRFYMKSRAMGYSAGIQELLWGFTHNYLNIVWTMFLRNLIVVLGTICCVFPGIYFGYCYYMVPYILAENPDMRATDALRMSKEMMGGQKLKTFVLEISFWGWWFLGAFLCGVGGVLIQPYYDATFAELYAVLRQSNGPSGYGGQGGGGSYYNDGYGQNNGGYYNDSYRQDGNKAGQSRYEYNDDYYKDGEDADYGYNKGASEWTNTDHQTENMVSASDSEDRGHEVKRSEGGPGRGYYLNGVFYPYTDDELRELEDNKHKN